MVEALKLNGKFATCLVTNTYNKKELEQSLKYLKGSTIYILVDSENKRKEIKEDTKSDLDLERIFNSIVKTNKNILKILVDIAKEVRLIDYNEQYKNDIDLICNEKGKIYNLPMNRIIKNDIICGTFIIAGQKNGELISLTDNQIRKYKSYFKLRNYTIPIVLLKNKYKESSNLLDYDLNGIEKLLRLNIF